MTKDMRARIKFFAEHAGYSTPPGRMACAKALAEAEILAASLELEVKWEQEQESYLRVYGDDAMGRETQAKIDDGTYLCLHGHIDDAEGNPLASLGMVTVEGMNDPYLRVVGAELAQEAIGALMKEGVS